MAFQLAKFLAHISPAALQAHLHATLPELAATIDWSMDAKALPAHVASGILESPMEASARARIDFERMEILARSPGDRAMVAACNHRNDLADSLKSLPNS